MIEQCLKVFNDSGKIYGYEKTFRELNGKGINISKWVVRRIFEENNISSLRFSKGNKRPKEKKVIDVKNPNLAPENFKRDYKNQIWYTDVSYLKVKSGFIYLSMIIDGYNNKVLDWKVSRFNNTNLVILNLTSAMLRYGSPEIIHSDHGYQYTSKRYIDITKKMNIKISMSRVGNSLDNRPIEFMFGLLKRESLYIYKPRAEKEVKKYIAEYTNWYNDKRIQSVLNWKSPSTYQN